MPTSALDVEEHVGVHSRGPTITSGPNVGSQTTPTAISIPDMTGCTRDGHVVAAGRAGLLSSDGLNAGVTMRIRSQDAPFAACSPTLAALMALNWHFDLRVGSL